MEEELITPKDEVMGEENGAGDIPGSPEEAQPHHEPPPPNNTIFVSGLNELVPRPEMKHALYLVFSQFGPILDLSAMKTARLKGQAFIVFAHLQAATAAMAALQQHILFDKPMVLEFAKAKSKLVAQMDGTWVERAKEPRTKKVKPEEDGAAAEEKKPKGPKVPKPAMSRTQKKERNQSVVLPNKVLFVQNLPEDCTAESLHPVLMGCMGLKDIRIVPGRKGWAFLEFGTEHESTMAMTKLQGTRFGEKPMFLSYQKRAADAEY